MNTIVFRLLAGLFLLAVPLAVLYKVDGRLFRQSLAVVGRWMAALLILVAVLYGAFRLQAWWLDLLLLLAMEGITAAAYCRKRWLTVAVLAGVVPATLAVGLLVLVALGHRPFDNAWLWMPTVALLHGEALRVGRSALLTYVYNRRTHASMYEYLQGNGATPSETVRPFLVRALTKALAPLFTGMRDTGLVGVPLLLCVLLLSGMPPLEAGIFTAVATVGMVCCAVLAALISVAAYEWLNGFANQNKKR